MLRGGGLLTLHLSVSWQERSSRSFWGFAGCQGHSALCSQVSLGRSLEGQMTLSPTFNQNLPGLQGGGQEPGHGPG